MSRCTTLFVVVAMLASVSVLPALAGNGGTDPHRFAITPMVVPGGYAAGTLSYGGGTFVANGSNGDVIALLGGVWQGRGFKASRPAWVNSGIACYDQQGYPAIWNSTELRRVTTQAQFSNPFVQPACSPNGDIAYGNYSSS